MKRKIIRIMITGGGTGGHVTPLIAVVKQLKANHPNWRISYLGARGDKIGQSLTRDTQLFSGRYFIHAGKWHRFGSVKKRQLFYFWQKIFWQNLYNLCLFIIGFIQTFIYLRRLKPQLIFSKGGYVSVSPCWLAKFLKIPLIIHDSDAVTGIAHSFVEDYARLCLRGFKGADQQSNKYRLVGVPVNPVFGHTLPPGQKLKILKRYNLPSEAQIILVTGGGGGARSLNLGVLELLKRFKIPKHIHFIIVSGRKYHQEAVDYAQGLKSKSQIRVLDFITDMPDVVRASLGIITRAGATILSEISLAKKPTIIVPNPILPQGHQLHNARIFQQAKAAWLVSDATGQKVNQKALQEALQDLINNPQKRQLYRQNIAKLANAQAVEKTVQAIEEVIVTEDIQQANASKHQLQQILKQRYKYSDQVSNQALKDVFKYWILILLIMGFLFKIFYVSQIRLKLSENSPLVSVDEIQAIEKDINKYLQTEENFFGRHLTVDVAQIQTKFLNKPYLKSLQIRRDLVSSEMLITLQPKQILGYFSAPNSETIITNDGYSIAGYENLYNQASSRHLTIISPYTIKTNQELVLSSLDLDFLKQINAYLASQGYKLTQVTISTNPREIILRLKDWDFDILALTTADPIEQGIALSVILDRFNQSIKASERLEESEVETTEITEVEDQILEIPTQYLDIRLIDRVIYK
ncbi:MAG: glycosyltransferase [Candidatus Saccharibacteria bacterium]|nr:glycosyltransferase [Candidatus Saccharibacteria bacterium]MCY4010610.1 glycosyltransferase [Candidatus Saccharibacteria bacterium]